MQKGRHNKEKPFLFPHTQPSASFLYKPNITSSSITFIDNVIACLLIGSHFIIESAGQPAVLRAIVKSVFASKYPFVNINKPFELPSIPSLSLLHIELSSMTGQQTS